MLIHTTQVELRSIRTDPDQFRNTRPMADEVLDFLCLNGLESYSIVFANHDVDNLAMVAALMPEQVAKYLYIYIYIYIYI